jgi:hypothetical protein
MNSNALFVDRVGILATMHHKEKVIAPLLEQHLGIKVVVPENFDTDAFGTFTREINRTGDQLEAAILKAEKGLALTGESLALASEGTFGPHPLVSYLPCNREIVVLLDKAHNIKLVGQEFSTNTNYSHKQVKSIEEAYEFALKAGFPEHGLVVMVEQNSIKESEVVKGITTKEQLFDAVTQALAQSCNGTVHVETDMRALYNPTRMKAIEKATHDLIKKINQVCPKCNWLGFEVIERKKGLPCALCNFSTELTCAITYYCKKCKFQQEVLFPNGLEKADPAQCMYCNP